MADLVWSISVVLVLAGTLAIGWRVLVLWRWNRDETQYILCNLLAESVGVRGTPEGRAEVIYHYIVDELRWDRVYAAKRLAHALTLVEARGASQAVNEDARKVARRSPTICGRRRPTFAEKKK